MGCVVLREWRLHVSERDCQVGIGYDNSLKALISFSVNGGTSVLVDQPDTGGGHVILSVPVKLSLKSGSNSITFANGQSSESQKLKLISGRIPNSIVSRLRWRLGQDHRVLTRLVLDENLCLRTIVVTLR